MLAKQISVFLENKAGRLLEATRTLGEAGVNIRALLVADTEDYGVLRMIVDDPDKTHSALKDAGFTVSETDVLAVRVPDRPGGLASILEVLEPLRVNIEYLYCFIASGGGHAIVVMRVDDPEHVARVLVDASITVLDAKSLYSS